MPRVIPGNRCEEAGESFGLSCDRFGISCDRYGLRHGEAGERHLDIGEKRHVLGDRKLSKQQHLLPEHSENAFDLRVKL